MIHIIQAIQFVKKKLNLKTYNIENFFVLTSLLSIAILFGKDYIEYIAVFAIYFTFKHANISNRMEEQEEKRKSLGQEIKVECYKKSIQFFYVKEILWFSYFALNGSYSALAGVIIFLLYGPWRKIWRKHNPI
jgi:hypothetical protein